MAVPERLCKFSPTFLSTAHHDCPALCWNKKREHKWNVLAGGIKMHNKGHNTKPSPVHVPITGQALQPSVRSICCQAFGDTVCVDKGLRETPQTVPQRVKLLVLSSDNLSHPHVPSCLLAFDVMSSRSALVSQFAFCFFFWFVHRWSFNHSCFWQPLCVYPAWFLHVAITI